MWRENTLGKSTVGRRPRKKVVGTPAKSKGTPRFRLFGRDPDSADTFSIDRDETLSEAYTGKDETDTIVSSGTGTSYTGYAHSNPNGSRDNFGQGVSRHSNDYLVQQRPSSSSNNHMQRRQIVCRSRLDGPVSNSTIRSGAGVPDSDDSRFSEASKDG